VIGILQQFTDYWDEDTQQRACEYIQMLQKVDSNPELIWTALENIPSFSDDLQSNNVLLRRIMKLKVEKGFAINQEEAEKSIHSLKYYESTVSSALSQNQPQVFNTNRDTGEHAFGTHK